LLDHIRASREERVSFAHVALEYQEALLIKSTTLSNIFVSDELLERVMVRIRWDGRAYHGR
jgi:hypothetical protein